MLLVVSAMSASAQRAHLLTNIGAGMGEELVVTSKSIRLIKHQKDMGGIIYLHGGKKIDIKKDDIGSKEIEKISAMSDIKVQSGHIYFKEMQLNIARNVRFVSQAIRWSGWIICVAHFSDPSYPEAPDIITGDIVYFKPDMSDVGVITTPFPGLELKMRYE